MNKLTKIILFIIFLTVVAGGSYLIFSKSAQKTPDAMPKVLVETVRVAQQVFTKKISTVGQLSGLHSQNIIASVPGKIIATPFLEGDLVKQGQLLFNIEDDTYVAEMKAASAALDTDRLKFEHAQKLLAKNVTSKTNTQELEAILRKSEATFAIAQDRLKKTKITAPFAGAAGIANLKIGDYASVGVKLLQLDDLEALKLEFQVPAQYAQMLSLGSKVMVTVLGQKTSYPARITGIDKLVDNTTGSFNVYAVIDNKEQHLNPGLRVDVQVTLSTKTGLSLPIFALIPAEGGNNAYLVQSGKVKIVKIETGEIDGDVIEVKNILKLGDEIVSAGHLKLSEGAEVMASDKKQ
jgi:membrane fusion protein (multidrug efflux system)